MQYGFGILKKQKILFATLFVSLLFLCTHLLNPLVAIDEARAELITFDEYPQGTPITNQYQNRGVVFSGDPQPPDIIRYTDGSGGTLEGFTGGGSASCGSIIAAFVDPNDGVTPVEATNLSFLPFYLWYAAIPVTVTYYDLSGGIIRQDIIAPWNGQDIPPDYPPKVHKFIIDPRPGGIPYCEAYIRIDNLSFQLSLLVIKQPKTNDAYPLRLENYTKTEDITFEAVRPNTTGQVNWVTTLFYATSSNRGQFTLTDSFSSQLNATTTRAYKSKGGCMTVGASYASENAHPVQYVYIVGNPIPDSEISSRLLALYHGATSNLLTGIAMKESNYRQFSNRTLFGYTGNWPTESYDGGSHMGLMQVPITMADSWDWQTNTSTGAGIFKDKIQTASRIERRIRNNYHGLRHLTDVEIENMALVLYGPFASANLNMQYYILQVNGNTAIWIINTANNPQGVAYADDVRALVR